MRKHRLAECLLADVIGVEWELVHREACRWEHVISDQAADRIDALLGRPSRSPYGNPFPARSYRDWVAPVASPGVENLVRFLTARDGTARAHFQWIGEPLQVDTELLGQLQEAGVLPNAEGKFALRGSAVLIEIDGRTSSMEVDHTVAAHLFVCE